MLTKYASIHREERVVRMMVLGLALAGGAYLAFQAGSAASPINFSQGLVWGWMPVLETQAERIGVTFWVFLGLMPLLPYGLLTKDTSVLNTFLACSVLTGSLGTVLGLMASLGVLNENSASGVMAMVPHLVPVFGSTAAGVMLALAGYLLALLAGIDVTNSREGH